jgi:hypothetical protein
LIQALDGELPRRLVVPLARHLDLCAGCRARIDQIEQTASAFVYAYTVHTPEQPARPLFSRTRLAARIAEEARSQPSWAPGTARHVLRRGPLRALLATAALALIVGAASWRLSTGSDAEGAGFVEREAGALPIASLTPGAILTDRAGDVCGEAEITAAIPDAVRAHVVDAYGMSDVPADEYELDFLITPGLGGSADARNLWPERYGSRVWNARVKDQLEDRLRAMVCHGSVDLATAQREIATDWIAAYRKYFKTVHPLGRS